MPIYRLDQTGVWKKLKVYRLNSAGVWKKLTGYRLDQTGVWKKIFGAAEPIIENTVELTKSSSGPDSDYHNSTYPVTLTGKKYHFSGANSYSYRFFSSPTGAAPWTPITTSISTTNPASGSSSTVTYQLVDADFTSNTMYFKFTYTGTNTLPDPDISTTSESNILSVTFLDIPAPPSGFPNINQSTISVASTASSGTWTGSPTLYQWKWQYGTSNSTLTYQATPSISSISLSGTTATATVFNHGFKSGDLVSFSGINGLFNQSATSISSVFTNFFSYTVSKTNWSFLLQYSTNDYVTYNGIIYKALLATPNRSTWSFTTNYTTGQYADYGSQLYIANNNTPSPRTNWNSSTTYTSGQYVNSGGNLWQAVGTSVNQTPFVGSDFWDLIDIYPGGSGGYWTLVNIYPTSATYWQSQQGATASGGTATGPNYYEGSSSSPISYIISSFPSTDYKTGTSLQGLTTRMNVIASNFLFTSSAYNSSARTIYGYPSFFFGAQTITGTTASIIYAESNMSVYDINITTGGVSISGYPKIDQANSSPISITGLSPGVTYTVLVTPKNADNPRVSGVQKTTTFTTPSPPVNTAVPTIGPMNGRTPLAGYAGYLPASTQLTATVGSWSNVSGSTTYSYQWFKEDSITGVLTMVGTGSQITFSGSDVDDFIFVKVTATNSDGSSATATSGTYILSQVVTVGTISPTTANQDVSTTFSFNISHYPTSYVVSWGDGTSDSYTVTANTSTVNASHTHTYASSGTFTITVTAQPGNKTNTASVSVAAPISISFDANGGALSSGPGNGLTTYTYTGNVGSTLTAPSATRQHYTFSTWRSPLSGGSPEFLTPGINYTFGSGELSVNRTFYAIWTANTYTVSYNYNGGSGSVTSNSAVYPGSVTLPSPSSRTGYTFNGWYTESSGGSFVGNAGSSYSPTSNVTLYAQWTAIIYTVTWNANGGTVSPTSSTGEYGSIVTAPIPTRTNHTFGAWRHPSSGDLLYTVNGGSSWTINGSLIFYATWTINQYTVTYNANGGSVSPTSATVNAGSSVTLPTPSRSGYTFNGWYTASSGGSFVGNAGSSYTPSSSVTIYAQWTINQYTVTWDANGGSVTPTSNTVNAGSSVTAPTPTRSGWTFLQWRDSVSGDFLYSVNAGAQFTPPSSITMYARWIQIVPGPPRSVSLTRNQSSWNGTSWTWSCTWLAPNTGGAVSTYEAYREVGTGTVGNATLTTIQNTSTPQTGLGSTSTTFSTTVQAAPRADAYVRACNSGGCSSYVSGNVG